MKPARAKRVDQRRGTAVSDGAALAGALEESRRRVLEPRESEERENAREKTRTKDRLARRRLRLNGNRRAVALFDAAGGKQRRGTFVLARITDLVQPIVQPGRSGERGA